MERSLKQVLAPFGDVYTYQELAPFSHTFTHFKLHIAPYHVTLSRRRRHADQDTHVWYRADQVADAPLPAPVKKLLLGLVG